MKENLPKSSPITLDSLFQANKARFDQIFGVKTEELKTRGLTPIPVRPQDLVSASMGTRGNSVDYTALLNEKFGNGWSFEIAESSVENGHASVLGKLTVNGATKMQFGSSRANGNRAEALQRAADDALAKLTAQFGLHVKGALEVPPTSGKITPPPPVQSNREEVKTATRAKPAPQQGSAGAIDPITLDLIENALRNARHEMDAVLFRSAMSPVIREQHDEFPMITDAKGRMIVGQFGSYIAEMLKEDSLELHPGDVIMQSDPFKCGGAISHVNDWMVLVPVFHGNALIGFTSMFGHMMDVGGPVAGSVPTAATSIFGEGIKIPPVKLYAQGVRNDDVFDLIMNNTRTPDMNYSDLMGIVAGCRAGEKRVIEICERFGVETYIKACDALLDRTNRAMRKLIMQNLPEEPQFFEDYVDDDGCGNGPFKMKLTIWREGDQAFFDWTGTSAQAEGPINFFLHEGMFKMFIGVYMIMVFDPQILFNDGFYDLLHVKIPKRSLLQPEFPAPLGCRTHTLSRLFDVLGGALSKNTPELATAAGYGSSPYFFYTGNDAEGRYFHLMEISFGGIPGRPIGDGMDGHAWWPLFENIPTEYLESYYPLIVESYSTTMDSGGAGLHRGGNGVEKTYLLLEDGQISIHDDRHLTHPWGILGGKPGGLSEKWHIKKDGSRTPLPSKVDGIKVSKGDRILFRTAGGGGWGDPLKREPQKVRDDVARKLASPEKARAEYGVILTPDLEVDKKATEELRQSTMRSRPTPQTFDFGPRPGSENWTA